MYQKNGKKCTKNPSRTLDITANIATASSSRNPKNVMKSLPELITFYRQVKICTLVNLFILCYINESKMWQIMPKRTLSK